MLLGVLPANFPRVAKARGFVKPSPVSQVLDQESSLDPVDITLTEDSSVVSWLRPRW